MKKINNVSELPVMPSHCKTCPFKPNKNGFWQNASLATEVIERNLFNSQQICHGTETGPNRQPHNRCKGYYDYAFEMYDRLGMDPKKHLKNQPLG